MATKEIYLADFSEEDIFHVYNRTNNKEKLFRSAENGRYFMERYHHYLTPFAETFCWCLLPNHFHFLVRIRSKAQIMAFLQQKEPGLLKPVEKQYLDGQTTAEWLLEAQWHRFFTSYSMAFNKQQQRKGNLLHRPFKRIEVSKDGHFTQAILYIHANPVKHGLCKDLTLYPWSSYQTVLSNKPTKLLRNEVLDWFGGREYFILAHQQLDEYYNSSIGMDEA